MRMGAGGDGEKAIRGILPTSGAAARDSPESRRKCLREVGGRFIGGFLFKISFFDVESNRIRAARADRQPLRDFLKIFSNFRCTFLLPTASIFIPHTMNQKYTFLFLLALAIMFVPACRSSSVSNGGSPSAAVAKMKEKDGPVTSIAELIRRQPSVSVTGSGNNIHVEIRGQRSFITTNEPLYVVNGQPLGNDYSYVAEINPGDVARLSVIRDPATLSSYGSRGANGVIEILLKK
jgi:hypothetical protein